MRMEQALIRKLLEFYEATEESASPLQPPEVEGYSSEAVNEHIDMCVDANLLKASPGNRQAVFGISLNGRRELERMRNA